MIWWLAAKIIGVAMVAVGVFLVVFFPGIPGHQEVGMRGGQSKFGLAGIVIGLVLAIVGGFIIFSP
jgi:hypothetical protein